MIKKHKIHLQVTGLFIGNYNISFDLVKKGDVNRSNQLKKKSFREKL